MTLIFFPFSCTKASKYLKLKHKICDDLDECFSMLKRDRTKVLAISRAHALNNPDSNMKIDDFFCFPISDDIVIYSAVMMFRKFHHLQPIINEKIRVIAESGLLTKWQIDSKNAGKKIVRSEGDANTGGHGNQLMQLRLEHVEGAFLLVLIGLSLALVVFLLELLICWLNRKKKSYRILNALERVLCHA